MKKILALITCTSLLSATAFAQGNQFKVRYAGGSVASSVKPDDWGNTLTVNSDVIIFNLKGTGEIRIDPREVKLLTHSRHASRKIGKYAALAIVSPLFLFGMLKKKNGTSSASLRRPRTEKRMATICRRRTINTEH